MDGSCAVISYQVYTNEKSKVKATEEFPQYLLGVDFQRCLAVLLVLRQDTLASAVKKSIEALRKLLKPRLCCCPLRHISDLQLEATVNDNEGGNGGDWRKGQSSNSKTGHNQIGKTLVGIKHFRNLSSFSRYPSRS